MAGFLDQPGFADDVRDVLRDLLGLPPELLDYTVQYAALNGLPIPISQITGFNLSSLSPPELQHNGADVAARPTIDFEDGGNVTFAVNDDVANNRVKVSASVPSASFGGKIDRGTVTVGPGADIHAVSFGFTFSAAPVVVIVQDTSNGQSQVYATVESITTTGFNVNFPAVGGAGRVYDWVAVGT